MVAEHGLITFGDALKAFRRGVYMFPDQWRAAVICGSVKQAHYALNEAYNIVKASSLGDRALSLRPLELRLDTGRGVLRFMIGTEGLQGADWPHIIIVDPQLSESMRGTCRAYLRHPEIEDRYFRLDDATL